MFFNSILLKFARKYPVLIVLTILLGFSGALFNGVSTALVVPLLMSFLNQEAIDFNVGPPMVQRMMSVFHGVSGETRLIVMLAVVLLAIFLKNAAEYIKVFVAGNLSRRLFTNIRLEGVKLLLEVDLDFYSKNKIGDINNRIVREMGCAVVAIRTAINMLTTIITISLFVFILLFISWQLTMISVGLLGIVALTNQYIIKRSKQYGKKLSETSQQNSNKLLEIFTGIRLIKTVANEEREYEAIKKIIMKFQKAEFDSQLNYALMGPINELSGIIVILFMVIVGRFFFLDRLDEFSKILLTYLVFLFKLLPFVGQLNGSRNKLANLSRSVEIVADFLRLDDKPFMPKGNEPLTDLKEGIKLEKVSFAYPGTEEKVLKDIDLQIPKGKMIALVGASGAGKSTIADLLPRFYDPTDGRITLDGKDLREYDITTLRTAMGVVSQDTFLFNNSVVYNIAYGCEDATEEQIIEAAKRANAYEFITKLPEGMNTEIGDRGVMLSGGQRQRIAIARALLRNPDILILDEATSALDTVSERLVQEAIDELCRERTTVVIAHRLSTVQKAHQIAVLDKGRIVEIGNHEELLEKKGYYSRLYSMQFSDRPKAKVVLPRNQSLLIASLQASQELRTRLSYEIRSSLNSMLGSVGLVRDGLIDSPEEQHELIKEFYESAIRLLNTIEFFEHPSNKLAIKN